MTIRRLLTASLLLLPLLPSCGGGDDSTSVVAALYPLAWAAERVGGPDIEVVDLTPPGTEAHDATLTAEQRAAMDRALVLFLLGTEGFQPEVEAAAEEVDGLVWPITVPPGPGGTLDEDPHVWLDPVSMQAIVGSVADAFAEADPDLASETADRAAEAVQDLEAIDGRFETGLADCRFDTIIASHEAFGHLAARYGFEQLGLTGLSPGAEPPAERLRAAGDAIREGRAGAVFYEATDEGERTGRSVADDLGVPAIPLSTLESEPEEGDYPTVMEGNLESLREGLGCS